jgi:hypothetical protein
LAGMRGKRIIMILLFTTGLFGWAATPAFGDV